MDATGYQECSTVGSSTFLNGITPSLELAKTYSNSLIFNISSQQVSLSYDLVFEFRILAKYVNMGLQAMMQTAMNDVLNLHNINLIVSCIAYSLLMVASPHQIVSFVTLFLMERLIGRSVDSEYIFIRQVYNHFVPTDLIENEKRLKALFKQAGILNN